MSSIQAMSACGSIVLADTLIEASAEMMPSMTATISSAVTLELSGVE